MPLRLEIKKELSNRSDRVKSVDIHPSPDNPWVLSALYNGNVYIWDYSNNVSINLLQCNQLQIVFHPVHDVVIVNLILPNFFDHFVAINLSMCFFLQDAAEKF